MLLLGRRRLVSLLLPLFAWEDGLTSIQAQSPVVDAATLQDPRYIIVGVSGGLQKGFPEHGRLDYSDGEESVPAVFLGRALVRGYKSYLDVMEPTWRQYVAHGEGQPLINCNVIPTGCYYDANEYWIYLIDTRQLTPILMNEPRFLSITPDLGLVDLQAEETSPLVRHVAMHESQRQDKTDTHLAAFPIVTGAWFNPTSHVPSPILYTKPDGTRVTNFPASLARWVGYDTEDKSGTCRVSDTESIFPDNPSQDGLAPPEFWKALTVAIRDAETQREATPVPSSCDRAARFGVSADMARINYSFSKAEFTTMLEKGAYEIDYAAAVVKESDQDTKAS